jgi:hypothetical protein
MSTKKLLTNINHVVTARLVEIDIGANKSGSVVINTVDGRQHTLDFGDFAEATRVYNEVSDWLHSHNITTIEFDIDNNYTHSYIPSS